MATSPDSDGQHARRGFRRPGDTCENIGTLSYVILARLQAAAPLRWHPVLLASLFFRRPTVWVVVFRGVFFHEPIEITTVHYSCRYIILHYAEDEADYYST